jgi:glycosyltransferase involved in cell wall biosynthesis
MQRIVSLTPSRVERDSRTFKEAASMARLGYDSHVVEALPSTSIDGALPFTLEAAVEPAPASPGGSTTARATRKPVERRARRALERLLSVPLTIAGYLGEQRRLAQRLPAADLYFVHGYHQFPAVWLAARRTQAPYVYDAHDFYPEFLEGGQPTRLESWLMRRFYLALESRCTRSATAVLTVSEGVAGLYERHCGRRPIVVRNCAELRFLDEPHPDLRTLVGATDDVFLLVAVGNHKPGTRAIAQAVESLAGLPDRVHLAFVGAGYEEFTALAGSLGVAARTHFVGPVPAPQVPRFIAGADAALILYLPVLVDIEYALPNGLFNSIAAGLPLLYPELPEIRRIAEEHQLGVAIDPSDPGSIAAGARALMDPQRAAAYRRHADTAREILNWEHEETVLAEVVASALASGR